MILFANILLTLASIIYLVPLQFLLRQPIEPSGHGSGGAYVFVLMLVPFWLLAFLSWCILFSVDGFAWLGGGRGRQFFVIFLAWLALAIVTVLASILRGESQIPWALRPLMPWGIYVLPLFVLLATFLLLNPSLGRQLPALAGPLMLGFCGGLALLSSLGMGVQWLLIAQRKATDNARSQIEAADENIRRTVAEVEVLDPVRDLGRLLGFAGAGSLDAPRALAVRKISTVPDLQQELARRLVNQWSLETLGYLELTAPPDPAALAEPVRIALENLAFWAKRELADGTEFWPESYSSETRMALAVADKFAPYGVDYLPAINHLRAAFDQPKAQRAKLTAPHLIDTWLDKKHGSK